MQARFNPSRHKDAVSVRVLTIPISARKDYNLFQRYFSLAYNKKPSSVRRAFFYKKNCVFIHRTHCPFDEYSSSAPPPPNLQVQTSKYKNVMIVHK